MKNEIKSFLSNALRDQRGQVLPMMALFMIGFCGCVGFVVDVGDVYYNFQQLQASTNAAAMAGAEGLPTSGTLALSNAALYNSQTGNKNSYGNLNVTGYTATVGCVTAAVGSSVPCVSTGLTGSQASGNAIQITQTAKVRTYFMAVLGTPSVTLTATGTALMRGGTGAAYNMAVVVDATQSMNTTDTNCIESTTTGKHGQVTYTYYTRFQCAMNGVQIFLEGIHPCAASGCGGSANSSGVYPDSVDRVSLFQFPEPSSSTQAAKDYTCGAGNPTITPYTFPTAGASSYTPGTGATYQITPYMSNFQTTDSSGDASGTLNTATSAYVPLAVGAKSGCGMGAPGGEGTYYAGAIYAAQASLEAAQAAEAANGQTVKNALIIVSDGAATASKTQLASGTSSSGLYPSYNNECKQAVTAAKAATAAGTTVYAVAYGSPTSGCTTDTLSGGITSPCSTMQQMASNSSTFYSDNNQSGSAGNCYSSNTPADLADIFEAISAQFTGARLIPNGAFPSS